MAIQSASEARDAGGKVTYTWSTLHTVRAGFLSHAGREFVQAQQIRADMTHLVELRWYSGLTTKHRLLFGTRELNILAIDNRFERDQRMLVLCKEAL